MMDLMVEAALRGLALALLVGLGLRLLRVRNVPARKAAWTLVLLASLAMPFLMRWPEAAGLPQRFAWTLPVRLRAMPKVAAFAPAPSDERIASVAPSEVQLVAPEAMTATALAEKSLPAAPRHAEAREKADKALAYNLPAVQEPALVAAPVADVTAATPTERAPVARPWPPAGRIAVWTYLAVSGALLLRLLIGLVAALRIWSTAELVSPLVATEPFVRASERIPSPVTIGSGIVLPADYRQWDRQKLRMVLAHEQSHVRQMDFYLQLLAGLYTAAFWFSPLGWWLRRTLSSLGEAIGDRAGMDAAASRSGYAELVLEFAALPRRALPGVAMARSGNLSKRVESMLNENLFRRAFAEGQRRAAASLLVIPVALFAATALVRVPKAAAQTAPATQATQPAAPTNSQSATPANSQPPQAQTATSGQSKPAEDQVTSTNPPDQQNSAAPAAPPQADTAPQVAPAAPPAPGADVAPAAAPAVAPAIPAAPPADLAPSAAPAPPPLVILPRSADHHGSMAVLGNGNAVTIRGPHTFLINNGDAINGFGFQFTEHGDSWAVVQGPGTQFTFSGSWPGNFAAEIDKARKQANGPFLWFHHDGKSYIVTDPGIVAKAAAMDKPMLDLGIRQRLVGQTQENLGKRQEEMAREAKEASDISAADVARMMADIQRESKEAQSEWNDKMKAEVDAELKAAQVELSPEKMAALDAQMKAAQNAMTPEKMAEVQASVQAAMKQLNSADMAAVMAKMKAETDRWNAQDAAQLQAQMAKMEAQLNDMRARLGTRQGDFGVEMGNLGIERGKLGEELGRLGEEQGKLALDMGRDMQKIIQETLESGKAQPLQ